MEVKTFRGATKEEALAQLHQALGQDAHVIAIREHDGHATAAGARAAQTADLEALLAPEPGTSTANPLERLLRTHNLPDRLRGDLIKSVPGNGTGDLAQALGELIRTRIRLAPLEPMPKALLLFGPTGAGKTAALVRLAARLRAEDRPLAVATTDVARTGATHQLQAMLAPLEIEPMVAATRDELELILKRNHDATLLVDSTGLNPLLVEELAMIADLIDQLPIEPLPVLPAGLDSLDMLDIAANCRALGATRALVTKLDMARRFASLLAIAEGGLALSEVSISPLLAKPLIPWSAEGLARLLQRPIPGGQARKA